MSSYANLLCYVFHTNQVLKVEDGMDVQNKICNTLAKSVSVCEVRSRVSRKLQ